MRDGRRMMMRWMGRCRRADLAIFFSISISVMATILGFGCLSSGQNKLFSISGLKKSKRELWVMS